MKGYVQEKDAASKLEKSSFSPGLVPGCQDILEQKVGKDLLSHTD